MRIEGRFGLAVDFLLRRDDAFGLLASLQVEG
jgi:hypothetical protein